MWVSVENRAVELDQPTREYQADVEVAFEPTDGVSEETSAPLPGAGFTPLDGE